jgi:hypothetical protein
MLNPVGGGIRTMIVPAEFYFAFDQGPHFICGIAQPQSGLEIRLDTYHLSQSEAVQQMIAILQCYPAQLGSIPLGGDMSNEEIVNR